jgi:hypothetical protein
MYRAIVSLAALSLSMSSACFDIDDGDGPRGGGIDLGGCDGFRLFPGECVDASRPFAFTTELDGLAPGAVASISTIIHESLDVFRVETSDPNVVDVQIDGERVVLTAVAEGTATVTAHREFGSQALDTLDISVEPVAAVDFVYVMRGNEPLAQVAGLAGSADTFHVSFRSATGGMLLVDGVVDLTAEGELSIGGTREPRLSDWSRAFNGGADGDALTVTFGQAGAGLLRAVGGGVDASLLVRVVDAADDLSIDVQGDAIVGYTMLLLRADMATGEPVAGVRGEWSLGSGDAGTLSVQADPASEAVFEAGAPGTARVSVDVDGVVVSTDLVVE